MARTAKGSVVLMLVLLGGCLVVPAACNANSGEQALARIDATVRDAVHGEFEILTVKLDDHSARITAATQQAVVAVSKVDNSTSDRVVNRVLSVGAVLALIMLVATYPVGKVLWLVGRRLKSNGGPGYQLQDQGPVLRS